MKKLSSLLEFHNEAAARYKMTRFWENKLEPAFGWHLLHFLMDSQYAGEIPEGTESLQEFKKNLAAGYNPAELKHGSVWILFAIKEQLADLPVPFRKDGFLLPFEWRNGAEITEHSPLLPEALRDLADKVKAQFCGEAANFYLYPDSCFQDQVDFSMPNTSFESGWGALVSGLYLALHPKTLLVEWPFSSIQYDFANKKMDKVGHLEEKLTLAASFKAEEFAVAPCQYKEAVHSLAKLQDNLPRKHPIQKMKIFMAKNSRNIEKTAAHIVRCNQHNWQRLIRNVSIVLLLLAIIAGVTYWDHNYREYTKYYIHYTEKGGIPVGIFELNSPDDIKAAHCAFIYRGRTALFGERILRKVEVRDPAGHLSEIDRKCLDYENVQNLHYTVDENGAQKLATIDVKDDKRKTLFTKHFLSNNFVDFYSAKGTHGISDSTFGATFAKVSEVPSHAKISRWGIIRNKVSGFTEKIIFYADNKLDSLPAANTEGYCGWEFERDPYGRETARYFLDDKGKRMELKDGSFEIKRIYKGRFLSAVQWRNTKKEVIKEIKLAVDPATGAVSERAHFINGLPGKIDETFKVKFEYYPNGLCKKRLFFDGQDQSFFKNDSAFGSEYFYYPNGKLRKQIYLSKDGKPMKCSTGVAGYECEYDKNLRVKRVCFLGEDGKTPTLHADGIAGWKDEYDSEGNLKQRMFFDTNGRTCLHKAGNAGWRAEFDALGRQEKCVALGIDGKMIALSNGIAGWNVEYKDSYTKRLYFNAEGKVCLHKDGNAGWISEFDSLGRQTKYTYLGVDEKPCLTTESIAGWKAEFDSRGNETKRMFFGTDGKVCLHKDGYAGWKAEFDSLGRQTKGIFLGVDEKPILLTSVGIAGWAARYDTRGNRIEQINLGKDKSFCLNKNGWVRWKKRFNHKNELIEQMFYGKNNRLQKHWCRIVKVSLVSLKGSRIAAGDISLNYSNAAENDILVNVVEKNKKMFFARKTSDGTYRIFEEYLPDKQIILNPENIEFADYQKLRTAYEKYRKRTNNFPERK